MIDYKSYNILWTKGIEPLIKKYQSKVTDLIVQEDAKERIWKEYCIFNEHCKNMYMKDKNLLLDRHKVCACYMYAIVKAHVVASRFIADTDDNHLIINELIAIEVGLSLLRAFIIKNIHTNDEWNEEKKDMYFSTIKEGIHIPNCNHGTYIENFANELYYTYVEGTYNILSLANTIFLLEIHTTGSEILKERQKKDENESERT